MTTGRQERTLLRPGILVAAVMIGCAGGYLWWMSLHQPDTMSSALPFAGFLVLMSAAAAGAEVVASPAAKVLLQSTLITILLAVGVAALMGLGIVLLALAIVEIALLSLRVQRLPNRKAIAPLALGCLIGVAVDAGFFNWTGRSH